MELGRRIHVVGPCGSGKTTLARALALRLGVPHVELDALHWGPGWVEVGEEALRSALRERIRGDGWVVDGNYGSRVRELVWPLVETLVWLDLPRTDVMRQVTARTVRRWLHHEQLWNGNRERLATTLLTKNSVLWWAWSSHAQTHAAYEGLLRTPPCRVVRLRTPREVRAFAQG